jgi:hypothetical protein
VTLWLVTVLSALIFLGSEATLRSIPIWQAQNVQQNAHIGVYLIVPEIFLGIFVYLAYC